MSLRDWKTAEANSQDSLDLADFQRRIKAFLLENAMQEEMRARPGESEEEYVKRMLYGQPEQEGDESATATGYEPMIKAFSAADLKKMIFPPLHWIIPDYLLEGLTILAGGPKLGKSWLALGIADCVASGKGVLGKSAQKPQEVLYCALEDSQRRLQNRLSMIKSDWPEKLHFLTADEARKGGGFLWQLERWIGENPETKLIIVDTLQKVRDIEDDNSYRETYNNTSKFKTIADKNEVGLMCIHHTKKVKSEDFLENLMGSQGLAGVADSVMELKRFRQQTQAVLSITGRDILEKQLSINMVDGVWEMLGETKDVQISMERQEILDVLQENGELTPQEIADLTERTGGSVRRLLQKMKMDGTVVKNKFGRYSKKQEKIIDFERMKETLQKEFNGI